MSEPFARSTCSLAGDRAHRSLACLLLVVALLAARPARLLFAKVEPSAVTDQARLEVVGLFHPAETAIAGKAAASYRLLGGDVTASDVLVELNAQGQRLFPCVRGRTARDAESTRQHAVGIRRGC